MTHKKDALMSYFSYSPLFHTLYDERAPVGSFGRGTHYSVLGAVQWADNHRRMMPVPSIQRFAVVWDEDHDERVIQVAEAAYMRGIFAPVLYIGERKAFLTVVVNEEFFDIIQSDLVSYSMAWQDICRQTHGDFWNLRLVRVAEAATEMVAAEDEKVAIYLRNIANLWNLGLNPHVPPKDGLLPTASPPPHPAPR
jgi:hypothetical protein